MSSQQASSPWLSARMSPDTGPRTRARAPEHPELLDIFRGGAERGGGGPPQNAFSSSGRAASARGGAPSDAQQQ
eukprot:15475481-Alexandrium_andersonii.AAC.1